VLDCSGKVPGIAHKVCKYHVAFNYGDMDVVIKWDECGIMSFTCSQVFFPDDKYVPGPLPKTLFTDDLVYNGHSTSMCMPTCTKDLENEVDCTDGTNTCTAAEFKASSLSTKKCPTELDQLVVSLREEKQELDQLVVSLREENALLRKENKDLGDDLASCRAEIDSSTTTSLECCLARFSTFAQRLVFQIFAETLHAAF
jgi:regulator of replication initiation timing